MKWAGWRAVQIAAGIGDRQCRSRVEPIGMTERDRCGRVGSFTLIGEVERSGAFAADEQLRVVAGIEQVEDFLARGFYGQNASGTGPIDAKRAAGAKRGDRHSESAFAQASISRINGT